MQQSPTAALAPPTPSEQCSSTKTVAILDVKFGTPGAAVRYIKVDPNVYAAAYDRDIFGEDDVRIIMRIALRAEGADNAKDIEFIGPDEIRNQAGVSETMSNLPGCGSGEQVEGPRIRVALDESVVLSAGIDVWPAEQGVDGAPSFPASREISFDVESGCGPVEMDATKARTAAAGLHQFADQLTTLAAELEAIGAV